MAIRRVTTAFGRRSAATSGAARGVHAVADDVIVTNGTQQAVDVIARVMLNPGDRVAVEDPGYSPARRLFQTLGAKVSGVPVDAEGLVVDAIPNETRLVYVSPSHQFPLGTSMSLRRRMALLAWARAHDGAILEDDYDSEFRFGGRPIEPVQMLDTSGRVIYVGSFSKTTLATLRLGFVIVPPSLRAATRAAKFVTDWHTSLPTQAAMAGFIDSGLFARHVRRMRTVYRARHERVVQVIGRDFADDFRVVPHRSGSTSRCWPGRPRSTRSTSWSGVPRTPGSSASPSRCSPPAMRRGPASCWGMARSRRTGSRRAWRGSGGASTGPAGRRPVQPPRPDASAQRPPASRW